MNINAYNAFVHGGGVAQSGQNGVPQAGRPRETAPNATQAAAPPQAQPQESRQNAQQPRPVLDLSDTALTRRDIPRGSIVDIVA